jgi:hypothetical protein
MNMMPSFLGFAPGIIACRFRVWRSDKSTDPHWLYLIVILEFFFRGHIECCLLLHSFAILYLILTQVHVSLKILDSISVTSYTASRILQSYFSRLKGPIGAFLYEVFLVYHFSFVTGADFSHGAVLVINIPQFPSIGYRTDSLFMLVHRQSDNQSDCRCHLGSHTCSYPRMKVFAGVFFSLPVGITSVMVTSLHGTVLVFEAAF